MIKTQIEFTGIYGTVIPRLDNLNFLITKNVQRSKLINTEFSTCHSLF